MRSKREKKLENLLAQFLTPVKHIPFEIVIKVLWKCEVLPFPQKDEKSANILNKIITAMRETCKAVQREPIERPRPNEVGNDMEPYAIRALQSAGLHADAPKTITGNGKSTGYPDIRIEADPYPIYLEVKTYAAKNRETTQRSFFLSPSDNSKVIEDAHHLLVGFEISREGNLFKPMAFEIAELYGLDCDMKFEFNSDNKRLYESARILAQERVS